MRRQNLAQRDAKRDAGTRAGQPDRRLTFEAGAAYVAVQEAAAQRSQACISRTTDFGKSWTKITSGIAPMDYVHVVREDRKRRGLLLRERNTASTSHTRRCQVAVVSQNLPDVPVSDIWVEDNAIAIRRTGAASTCSTTLRPCGRRLKRRRRLRRSCSSLRSDARHGRRDADLPAEETAGEADAGGARRERSGAVHCAGRPTR